MKRSFEERSKTIVEKKTFTIKDQIEKKLTLSNKDKKNTENFYLC